MGTDLNEMMWVGYETKNKLLVVIYIHRDPSFGTDPEDTPFHVLKKTFRQHRPVVFQSFFSLAISSVCTLLSVFSLVFINDMQ